MAALKGCVRTNEKEIIGYVIIGDNHCGTNICKPAVELESREQVGNVQ